MMMTMMYYDLMCTESFQCTLNHSG